MPRKSKRQRYFNPNTDMNSEDELLSELKKKDTINNSADSDENSAEEKLRYSTRGRNVHGKSYDNSSKKESYNLRKKVNPVKKYIVNGNESSDDDSTRNRADTESDDEILSNILVQKNYGIANGDKLKNSCRKIKENKSNEISYNKSSSSKKKTSDQRIDNGLSKIEGDEEISAASDMESSDGKFYVCCFVY